jgi:flavoprotein
MMDTNVTATPKATVDLTELYTLPCDGQYQVGPDVVRCWQEAVFVAECPLCQKQYLLCPDCHDNAIIRRAPFDAVICSGCQRDIHPFFERIDLR